jgi:hypothetical protein
MSTEGLVLSKPLSAMYAAQHGTYLTTLNVDRWGVLVPEIMGAIKLWQLYSSTVSDKN